MYIGKVTACFSKRLNLNGGSSNYSMIQKILLFRNLIDNIPKNIGLYMVGVILLLANRISIEITEIGLGLAAFLILYSSIYVLNDLFDIDEDMKSGEKIDRKPLAKGTVKKNEALMFSGFLLAVGILFSILLNLIFLGVICILFFSNILYSSPLYGLKRTVLGLPLVLIMQILKIFLPWTVSAEFIQFPTLFVLSFSLIYLIIFQGYKERKTIGESTRNEPVLFRISIAIFVASVLLYPYPLFQICIMCYLLAGIVFFRNSHLIDRKVLMLSPLYILLGVILLFYLLAYL
jgi:4-hydroxybenzoate polyprenyltransferase